MPPLFAPVVLVILAGLVILVIGLIMRKRKLILWGTPSALLIGTWLLMASIPPNAEREFDRIFGSENRKFVTNIDTSKPTFMDGHFFSFDISETDFNSRIRPGFEYPPFTNFNLLRGQKLPRGWPASVAKIEWAFYKELSHQEILVHYDNGTHRAFGSVRYDQW